MRRALCGARQHLSECLLEGASVVQFGERIHERLALGLLQLLAQSADLGGGRAHLLL